MHKEVVNAFKKAIRVSEKEGKPTRIKNLFGHLNKNRQLREWFLKHYPTPTSYILFVHENAKHFDYDQETGNISVKTNFSEAPTDETFGGKNENRSAETFASKVASSSVKLYE